MVPTTLVAPVERLDHIQGPPDAAITLVEYGDFECPACGAAYPILERLRNRFDDRLRFVFRHFPLVDIHPHALAAALAAEAATDGGKFWVMHGMLYTNQRHLTDEDLARYATRLGLPDAGAIGFRSQDHLNRVERDLASGRASAVPGTPALFFNGRLHEGPVDLETLSDVVRSET